MDNNSLNKNKDILNEIFKLFDLNLNKILYLKIMFYEILPNNVITNIKEFYYYISSNNFVIIKKAILNLLCSDELVAKKLNIGFYNLIKKGIIINYSFEEPNCSKIKRRFGSFFKYLLIKDFPIDLTEYGILKTLEDKVDGVEYKKHNSLYWALKKGGMSIEDLLLLKLKILTKEISFKNLSQIAELLKIKINLYNIEQSCIKYYKPKDNKFTKEYDICYIDDHYMFNDDIPITSYYLYNYDEIKNLKDAHKITGVRYVNADGKKIYKINKQYNTLKMSLFIKHLMKLKDKFLIKINRQDLYDTIYYDDVENVITDLNYNDNCVKLYEYEEKFMFNYDDIIFFDFETYKDNESNQHFPYLVSWISNKDVLANFNDKKNLVDFCLFELSVKYHLPNKKDRMDKNIGLRMIKRICERYKVIEGKKHYYKNVLFIAHNLKYDLSFIYDLKELTDFREIRNGGRILQFKAAYCYFPKNSTKCVRVEITFIDSYSFISTKLSSFPSMFGFNNIFKKELINYELYNDLLNVSSVDFNFNIDYITNTYYKGKEKEFRDNVNDWRLVYNNNVDLFIYSCMYCKIDVVITALGINIFAKTINDISMATSNTPLDIFHKITISSIAEQLQKNNNCYVDCYSLSGHVREFISNCLVGGRVMTANNKKIKIKDNKLYVEKELIKNIKDCRVSDFDGVSLYPSAISRLDGFLKGKPKVCDFVNKTSVEIYNFLAGVDGYYVECLIKKIGIKRDFPLLTSKKDNDNRIFSNDLINTVLYLDKTSLEDIINFHKVEIKDIEFIRGYYFNEGFNRKIVELNNYLFNERIKLKKEDNPLQNVYKLILNSFYGKTIQKEHPTETKFFNNKDEALKYLVLNYNQIKEGVSSVGNYKFKALIQKEISNHFNYPHLGSQILSMSKRIMNEVMCLAEDNNIKIFYQDTDNIHMFLNDIDKLNKLFKLKYNRDLVGENLGQFYYNFEYKNEKNLYAIVSIYLDKKCFLNILKNKKMNKNNKYGYYMELDNVSVDVINYHAKKWYGNVENHKQLINIYDDLYNGKKLSFDLTCDQLISNKFDVCDKFIRVIQFK